MLIITPREIWRCQQLLCTFDIFFGNGGGQRPKTQELNRNQNGERSPKQIKLKQLS